MKIKAAVMVILSTVLAGCTSNKNLAGTYSTVELKKDGIVQNVIPSEININSESDIFEVNGIAGVNSFSGSAKVSGSSFKFINVGVTKMMGSPEENEFETLFLECLQEECKYEFTGDCIILKNNGVELKLKKVN